jgi:hypothetical protein
MTKAQEMLELADLIEEGEGLMLMRSCKETPLPFQIGIKRTAIVIAALRLAAQADAPGGQPQEPKQPKLRQMYDAQNGDHYVVDESGNAYEPALTRPDRKCK